MHNTNTEPMVQKRMASNYNTRFTDNTNEILFYFTLFFFKGEEQESEATEAAREKFLAWLGNHKRQEDEIKE